MSTTNENDLELIEQPQTPFPGTTRQNPKWVGPIMAFCLPGSAHFLAGQRRAGILWFLAYMVFLCPLFFLASLPGMEFFYAAVGFFVLLYAIILIASWRPTQRIGCSGWLLFFGVILFLQWGVVKPYALVIKTYITEAFAMSGTSMRPTLIGPAQRPDYIIVNKWVYRLNDPKRGDVVTFKVEGWFGDSATVIAKRVVGLPGETVDIEPPYVLINGKRLTEPPIFERISAQEDGFAGYCTADGGKGIPLPLTLGPDEYFLMGDNSPNSFDSRYNGPVSRQNITGQVIRIYYPFDRIRELE